jgi:Lysine 2,3-aminomutase
MMPSDIAAACDFISKDKRINTVLITGGDPMADISITENVLRSVAQITNIVNIRIGTRHLLFQPTSFSGRLLGLLREYRKDIYPKNISMYLSFNHPDELTLEVKSAIRRIRDCGIVLRGHTVLLKGVNDKSEIIRDLMSAFVSEEIVPYYLYHCMDVTGTAHLRTSVQRGIDIVSSLATLSGTLAPQYVYVTPVGKHRVFPNKVLDYVEIDGSRYIRSLGPYTASKFKEFTGKTDLPRLHQESDDGLIVSHYLDGNDE